MTLKCTGKCIEIYKKSSSPAFKDLQIDDIIEFSIYIERVGTGRSGSHAAYIRCSNPKTSLQSKLSFNQIGKVLENFKFIQI